MKISVLDLFSGLGGWSQAFVERGHKVTTVDINPDFKPTIVADIGQLEAEDLEPYGPFDIILASPPCNCFSLLTASKYWPGGRPNEKAKEAIRLVGHTIKLILCLNPRWWILENPRGMLRKVLGPPVVTTYWASWGEPFLKPTDLWGVLPKMRWPKPKNWERVPKGSGKGIQRLGIELGFRKASAVRAKIPYGLSLAVCMAVEREMMKESI